MPITINGTTGISGVDGSATTPAIKGSDTTGNGIFYGTDTVSIATSGSTAVTVDTNQNVGIGTTSPAFKLDIYDATNTYLRMYGETNVIQQVMRYSTDANSAQFQLYKARGTSNAPTTVINNDITGRLNFFGNDGTSNLQTAEIRSNVDAAPGTGSMPGRLGFFTTASGASNVTERMRIDNAGNVAIGAINGDSRLYVKSTSSGTVDFKVAFSTTDYFGISSQSDGYQLASVGGTNALRFATGGAERARIDSSGNVLVTGGGGLGYGTGSGGAVTQATSRTTGVTLNNTCGAITLFTTTAVVGTWFSFTVTNSTVVATDTVVVSVKSGTNTYIANVSAVSLGSFRISAQSISGTASDAPVINFAVIKAVTA